MHHLYKGFMEKFLYWYAYRETFAPYETTVERMAGSTSSASNVHEVETDNSNPYRTMVMDAMRINQGYAGQFPIINEEPNVDATRFFDFLKDSNELL